MSMPVSRCSSYHVNGTLFFGFLVLSFANAFLGHRHVSLMFAASRSASKQLESFTEEGVNPRGPAPPRSLATQTP